MPLVSETFETTQLKAFRCNYSRCGKAFLTKHALEEHDRTHNPSKPYTCFLDTCRKQFSLFSSLQKHERIHRGERPYECNECGLAFTQVSNLRRHERLHAGLKPHVCNICSKAFSTHSNLREHAKIHENQQVRTKYECSKCKKLYLYQSSLNKHLKNHDRVDRTHPDDFLGLTPQSSYKLSDGLYESAIFLEGSSPEKKLVLLGESDPTALVLLPKTKKSESNQQNIPAAVPNQQISLDYSYLSYLSYNQGDANYLHYVHKQLSQSKLREQAFGNESDMFLEPLEASLPRVDEDLERTLSPHSGMTLSGEEEEQDSGPERPYEQKNLLPAQGNFEEDALTVHLQNSSTNQNSEQNFQSPLNWDISSTFGYEDLPYRDAVDEVSFFSLFD